MKIWLIVWDRAQTSWYDETALYCFPEKRIIILKGTLVGTAVVIDRRDKINVSSSAEGNDREQEEERDYQTDRQTVDDATRGEGSKKTFAVVVLQSCTYAHTRGIHGDY